jgi:hypothetical protein
MSSQRGWGSVWSRSASRTCANTAGRGLWVQTITEMSGLVDGVSVKTTGLGHQRAIPWHEDEVHLAQVILERPPQQARHVEQTIPALTEIGHDLVDQRAAGHELEQADLDDEHAAGPEERVGPAQHLQLEALHVELHEVRLSGPPCGDQVIDGLDRHRPPRRGVLAGEREQRAGVRIGGHAQPARSPLPAQGDEEIVKARIAAAERP